jgi:hypothetical protein
LYGPIRNISVERRGTRVKRFFVSEARRAELENLTEARQSGAPGDFSGASFWYFLREKVLRVFMNLIAFSRNIKPNSIPWPRLILLLAQKNGAKKTAISLLVQSAYPNLFGNGKLRA